MGLSLYFLNIIRTAHYGPRVTTIRYVKTPLSDVRQFTVVSR